MWNLISFCEWPIVVVSDVSPLTVEKWFVEWNEKMWCIIYSYDVLLFFASAHLQHNIPCIILVVGISFPLPFFSIITNYVSWKIHVFVFESVRLEMDLNEWGVQFLERKIGWEKVFVWSLVSSFASRKLWEGRLPCFVVQSITNGHKSCFHGFYLFFFLSFFLSFSSFPLSLNVSFNRIDRPWEPLLRIFPFLSLDISSAFWFLFGIFIPYRECVKLLKQHKTTSDTKLWWNSWPWIHYEFFSNHSSIKTFNNCLN